jgi:hypothetical protein
MIVDQIYFVMDKKANKILRSIYKHKLTEEKAKEYTQKYMNYLVKLCQLDFLERTDYIESEKIQGTLYHYHYYELTINGRGHVEETNKLRRKNIIDWTRYSITTAIAIIALVVSICAINK